jgi:hypothetical protein
MAVKTKWTVEHTCGHTASVDLSDRPADRRAGYVRWLAGRDCTDCWKASRDNDAQEKAAWLENKRAEKQAEAGAWAEQHRMPPLDGTDRTVAWGSRCRHQLMSAAYAALVLEGDTTEPEWEAVEGAARTVTRGGWWIDQREAESGDLPELLQAVGDADRSTENPYA